MSTASPTSLQPVRDIDDQQMYRVTCTQCGLEWLYAGESLAQEQAASHRCETNPARDPAALFAEAARRPGETDADYSDRYWRLLEDTAIEMLAERRAAMA